LPLTPLSARRGGLKWRRRKRRTDEHCNK